MAPKPPRPWTVLPHGPLQAIDDDLWSVEGDVPSVPGLKRRMSIVRRSDGRLLFYNAVPVDDATLERIRSLGTPAQLVVPHHLHMIDARPFREKLGVSVHAPASARAKVEEGVPVDGALEDLAPDPAFAIETVAGFRTAEGILLARSGPRASLLVADLVLNVRRIPGLAGLLMHLLGMTGERPRLPVPVRLRVLHDRRAVREQLERLAATPGLARVVPSHGPIVDRDPAGALREIARSL